MRLSIRETTIASRQLDRLLTHESYRRLQLALSEHPTAGAVIPGSGGLRKVRWSREGEGKQGGLRVIYRVMRHETVYILFVYDKSRTKDLSREQVKALRSLLDG